MPLPRLRLEPRLDEATTGELVVRAGLGFLLALVLGAVLLAAFGYDPVVAYGALYRGAFGTARAVAATLNKSVPIALCAYGIACAYRARLWNIGAEGQLYMGACAATGIGLHLPPETPAAVAMPLFFLAAVAGGAAWAAIAAIPRATIGMNEILSTLMLTYIAILFTDYLVLGPWVDPAAFSFPYSPPVIEGARLGVLYGGVHWGIVFSIAGALLLHAIDRGLPWGYRLRVVGDAPLAARYGGIDNRAVMVLALVLAGAFAGLAGAIEVSASTTRLQTGLSPGYGFMAILVAWLANARPFGILVASILYAGLLNGGFALQVSKIPPAVGTILQATILLSVLAIIGLANYRVRFLRPQVEAP
ncbi:MAG: ABC transporter permease [Parvibaculaceae bacterium]